MDSKLFIRDLRKVQDVPNKEEPKLAKEYESFCQKANEVQLC